METYLMMLKNKVDEIKGSSTEVKDASSLEELIDILTKISHNEPYDSELLNSLVVKNGDVLNDSEKRIINYLVAVGNVGKLDMQAFALAITDAQAEVLNSIIVRLNQIIESSKAPAYLEKLYTALTTNIVDLDTNELNQSFKDLNVSNEIQCYVLLALLSKSANLNNGDEPRGFSEGKERVLAN